MRYGSRVPGCGDANTGARAATETKPITITKPAIDSGFRFMRLVKSDGSDQNTPTATTSSRKAATSSGCWMTRTRTMGAAANTASDAISATPVTRSNRGEVVRERVRRMTLIMAPSLQPDTGINRRVKDIGRQVPYHRDEGNEHPEAPHTWNVQLHRGLTAPLPDPRVVDDRLSQYHPAQKPDEYQAGQRHHGAQCVFPRVAIDDHGLGQPFGPCRPHVVLPQDLQHRRTSDADYQCHLDQHQRHRRPDDVAQRIDEDPRLAV